VAGSNISTTSSALVRVRSPALTLTDAKEYRAEFGVSFGGSMEFIGARVIGL
jgi:hypothetical protein